MRPRSGMTDLLTSRTVCAIIAISAGAFLLGFLFWHFDDTDPMWSIASFVLVYDPDMRSAFRVGLSRLAHTILGTALALAAIYLFGLHKWLMPLSLAIGALVCGALLRFRGSWRVLLVTISLVVGSALLEPENGLRIALTRALEVSTGSILAIVLSSLAARVSRAPGAAR